MFVNINDATTAFDSKSKVSMRECFIHAYPTNNVNDLKISFKGNNFIKLLEVAGVDDTLIFKLQERKSLNDLDREIRNMVSKESFLPMYDDDEYLSDEWSEIRDIAELRLDFKTKDISDEDVKNSLTYKILVGERNSSYDGVMKLLDFFYDHYKNEEIKLFEKLKIKDDEFEKSIYANTNQYVFDESGILISKELDFKIKGEQYTRLLKNTKEYVELHGQYVIDKSLRELKNNVKNRKNVLEHLESKSHHNFNIKDEKESIEFFKWLIFFSKTFPIYYDN